MSDASTQTATAPAADDPHADFQKLNALVVDCPELRQLEKLLGNFNVFRALKLERFEIRHSNMLAWLLQPDEAHGLKDLFLRRWLMRVFHESPSDDASYIDPAEIDSMSIRSVEVFREWNHIDLLVSVETFDDGELVIAIENKVDAEQSEKQLEKYRQLVDAQFKDAKHRLFIFLTQREQEPEDDAWAVATYAQVHDVLEECIEEQRSVIGAEPRVLLDHYLRLLKESFMENTEIAQLARKIYQKHSRALDIILEHRPDALQSLTDAIAQKMEAASATLGIVPMLKSKGFVRFIPKTWDTPANRAGEGWGKGWAFILCELQLWGSKPVFKMVEGQAPKLWRDELWKLSRNAPFKNTQNRKIQPTQWMSVYSVKGSAKLDDLDGQEIEEVAAEMWKWVEQQLKDEDFKKSVEVVKQHLVKLPMPPPATGGQS